MQLRGGQQNSGDGAEKTALDALTATLTSKIIASLGVRSASHPLHFFTSEIGTFSRPKFMGGLLVSRWGSFALSTSDFLNFHQGLHPVADAPMSDFDSVPDFNPVEAGTLRTV